MAPGRMPYIQELPWRVPFRRNTIKPFFSSLLRLFLSRVLGANFARLYQGFFLQFYPGGTGKKPCHLPKNVL